MNELLQIKNLKVSYHTHDGDIHAVQGVSFTIDKGEAVALVGESGCGKSVTAKSILGLIQPPVGRVEEGSEIFFEGKNLLLQSKKEWQKFRGKECAIVFQDALASLNPTLTVGKQIAEKIVLHNKVSKKEAYKEAERLLGMVGITDAEKRISQYPHEFSGGMRQRVMIAIALACNPKLLIADEPTTALDVTIQADILDLIKQIQKDYHMTVIMITHDLGIVANIAKKIIVMYSGKIVESGSNYEIFYNPKHPYTRALLNVVLSLDSDENCALVPIEGTPPNMLHTITGCAFADRCEHCMEICRKHEPPVFMFEDDHIAQCWLYHEMADNNRKDVEKTDGQ